METVCLLCKTPRGPDVRRCHCGYVYDPPPRPGFYSETDPECVHDNMPRVIPSGIFGAIMLLFITGTNATAVPVVGLVVMTSTVLGAAFEVRAAWVTLIVGATAVGFDLLARLMLRCSLGDMTRGSQLFHLPVWVLGVVLVVIVGCMILAR